MEDVTRSAAFPWKDGKPPHLPCGPGDCAASALLPGDPDRVALAAALLDDVSDHGRRREFQVVTGRYRGHSLTICSTGIGGPSTEVAVVELAGLGVQRAVRIGGMGALADDLPLGGFLIVTEASGDTGTARTYGTNYPMRATPRIAHALAAAASRLGAPHRMGRVRTSDSYYLGQGRALRAGGEPRDHGLVARLSKQRIDGMDMETEALFAVGHAMSMEVGAILAVHGHRATNRWLEDYEPTQRLLVRIAAEAMADLA